MQPEEISFDRYLDLVFDSPNRMAACTSMLAAFLETIDSCRDSLEQDLPEVAPSIVDQVAALMERARRLERDLRGTAERHGPQFKTSELGAVLWWAGMALHKAAGAAPGAREKMAHGDWDGAFIQIHSLMFETMSSLALLWLAEDMIRQMEAEGVPAQRGN